MTTSAPGRFSLEHGMRLRGLAMARPETFTDAAFLLFLGPLAQRLKKLVRWLVPACFGAMLAAGDAVHAEMDPQVLDRYRDCGMLFTLADQPGDDAPPPGDAIRSRVLGCAQQPRRMGCGVRDRIRYFRPFHRWFADPSNRTFRSRRAAADRGGAPREGRPETRGHAGCGRLGRETGGDGRGLAGLPAVSGGGGVGMRCAAGFLLFGDFA